MIHCLQNNPHPPSPHNTMSRNIIVALLFVFSLVLCGSSQVFAQKPESIDLLKAKNFDDLEFHFAEADTKGTEIFSFNDDGVLDCKGLPFGYVATKKEYKNFKVTVQYRWPEGVKPTNSGVFLRINEQKKDSFLPRGFEVQLAHNSAGDLWGFHGMRIEGPKDRHTDNPNAQIGPMSGVKRIEGAEAKPGEWNTVEALANEGLLVVVLNGKIVNWTTEAEVKPGKIGLQSEGGPIQFRNFILTPMDKPAR